MNYCIESASEKPLLCRGMAPPANRDLLGDSDENDDVANIKINEAYAKRFAHNKQREALHRLQELKKQGHVARSDSDSESSDEDEDEDGLIPERTEIQIYETLAKIKKKDPLIYQKDAKLYNEGEDEGEEENVEKPKKKKSLYLKDVMAQHLLENGSDFEEKRVRNVPKSYAEEQDELKRAFMEAGESDDEDDGGLLTVKKKTAKELLREKKEEDEAVAEAEQRAKDAGIARKLNEYFGKDDDLDENDRFLKNYLMNKGWIERENKGFDYGDVGVSEDEEELEEQERYEAEYNFRFEEGAGDQVLGHPRFAEGSVRKKSNARQLQRKNKQERLALAEFERKEELKHLKNVKKKEILEKLEKIRSVAGVVGDQGNVVDEEDLEDDFDPAEYDRKMREAFGDEYYVAEDPDEEFQGHDVDYLEKPDFDAEDELLGLPKGWDGRKDDGFNAAREKAKAWRRSDPKSVEDGAGEDEADADEDADEGAEEDEVYEDEREGAEQDEADEDEDEEVAIIRHSRVSGVDDGDGVEGVGDEPEETRNRKKRKGRVSLREKLVFDKQLEEYYKLDYEDVVGDLRTRFKYKEVPSNSYGLSTEEILVTDDKELNQYVSLKKLAPYRIEEWKPPKHHRLSQKKRKRLALQGGVSDPTERLKKFNSQGTNNDRGLNRAKGQKKSKTKGRGEDTAAPSSNDQERKHTEETHGAVDSTSKKRRQKSVPVIPFSRLIAYGKVPFRMKKTNK